MQNSPQALELASGSDESDSARLRADEQRVARHVASPAYGTSVGVASAIINC
jgi:hypothetical protein